MHLRYCPLLSARKTSFSIFSRADRPAGDSSLFIWKCLRSPCFRRIVLLGTDFSAERFWWWWPWRCQRLDCVVHGLPAPTVSDAESALGPLRAASGWRCFSCCFRDSSYLGRRWSFRPRVVFLPLSLWLLVGLPFCSAHRNLRFWPFFKKLLLFLFIPQNHNLSWPIFRFTSSFFCLFKSVVNSSFHLSYFADAELLLVSLL